MSRPPRLAQLLPAVVALGAIALVASEFLVAFEYTLPGGEVEAEESGADRDGYANLLLAVGAVIATVIALRAGSRPAAFAVAGLGVTALLLFLLLDLPDAGETGTLEGFVTAEAEPGPGFWLEAVGAVALGLGGAALATLDSAQLRAAGRRRLGRGG